MLSPEELSRLYASYERDELEQAVALGPLEHTRDAWIALCAECEKRGIPWNVPAPAAPAQRPAAAPLSDSDALKQCHQAAMTCGAVVAFLACIAAFFLIQDWHNASREINIWLGLALIFGFFALVVKKMYDGSPVALWMMGLLLALPLWFIGVDLVDRQLSAQRMVDLIVLVPLGMEIMVVRAIVALRRAAKVA